jgi:3,4-dihydroxy 2-butanone 4-phosphate synthase / GTP cyclohydrolase II
MPGLFEIVRERLRALLNGHRRQPGRRVASARLPTDFGDFDIHVYESRGAAETHVALVRGDLGDGANLLVRVHSSCVTGDIFHSARCDCGPQLHEALGRIAEEGRGVLIYLNQEGRGIGRAALEMLEMLRDLGVRSVRLMSNNPKKLEGLTGEGFAVNERLPIEIAATAATQHYLRTKKNKLGHLLSSV